MAKVDPPLLRSKDYTPRAPMQAPPEPAFEPRPRRPRAVDGDERRVARPTAWRAGEPVITAMHRVIGDLLSAAIALGAHPNEGERLAREYLEADAPLREALRADLERRAIRHVVTRQIELRRLAANSSGGPAVGAGNELDAPELGPAGRPPGVD